MLTELFKDALFLLGPSSMHSPLEVAVELLDRLSPAFVDGAEDDLLLLMLQVTCYVGVLEGFQRFER